MPNTGKPSRDCYRCRERRVKCDLGQPQCQRCLRIGKECPGYRDESELMFRHESMESFASSASTDRRRSRTTRDTASVSQQLPSDSGNWGISSMQALLAHFDKVIYSSGWTSPPSRGLPETWDNYAMPFILSQFSAPTEGERFLGFLDFFPQMVEEAGDSSLLIRCCKAVAYMYFDNKHSTPEGTARRVAAYGEALSATNNALGDAIMCQDDETLVSIWLLSVYELMSGSTMSFHNPGPPTWNMHVQGLVQLMRLRGPPQLSVKNSRNMFWMLLTTIQVRALAAGVECIPEMLIWLNTNAVDIPADDIHMYGGLVHGYHAASLCARMRRVIDSGTAPESETISDLIEEARRLGQENEAKLAQDPLRKPLSLKQVHVHNYHRTIRTQIQYCILELLRSDAAMADPSLNMEFMATQQRQSISIVQALAQNTLATISYILGPRQTPESTPSAQEDLERPRFWPDALRFLWPIRMVASRHVATKEQRATAEEALIRLNAELCIRAAVTPYFISLRQQSVGIGRFPKPGGERPRLRRYAPKSRNGCKTCRRRKVKCDEEKPFCRRCRTSQLDCEGYNDTPGASDVAQASDSAGQNEESDVEMTSDPQ